MTTFSFKELDIEGQATLEAIAAAPNFNEWMYTVTSRRLTGRILEIGSGIGNISEQFLNDGRTRTTVWARTDLFGRSPN
jgi:16S rRNA A1518/A1519 N6-dimethyltransferase RsmA/KsgA/DIM1 with predicted DNA glycosylase/AP lyase activity